MYRRCYDAKVQRDCPASPDLLPTPDPTSPAQLTTTEPATVSDEWAVRTYVDSVFVKVGRVYLDAGALILRSDRDTRGFVIPEDDLDESLTGGIGAVLLFDQTATVGTARLSQSGLALNIVIDTQLHTVPMRIFKLISVSLPRKTPHPLRHRHLEPCSLPGFAILCDGDAGDREDLA